MTNKQKKTIERNLHAFIVNYGELRIETGDCGCGFYIYYPANNESWIEYAHNIDYLDGWLMGCVQAKNHLERLKKQHNIKAEFDD